MISESLKILRAEIEKAQSERPLANRPTLLAASKGQSKDAIGQAIGLGIDTFGENRVQDACEKWPDIKKSHPDIALHLIGPLQTNKAKQALALFDVIQTLDRPKLALAIARDLGKPDHRIIGSLDHRFFIQVNTGEEPQKAGILPKEADDFIRYCKDELELPVTGLMCIPPAGDVPAPHFALLNEIAKRHDLKELSMGMSSDYITAIRMGATCIRIGTGIFGKRDV